MFGHKVHRAHRGWHTGVCGGMTDQRWRCGTGWTNQRFQASWNLNQYYFRQLRKNNRISLLVAWPDESRLSPKPGVCCLLQDQVRAKKRFSSNSCLLWPNADKPTLLLLLSNGNRRQAVTAKRSKYEWESQPHIPRRHMRLFASQVLQQKFGHKWQSRTNGIS